MQAKWGDLLNSRGIIVEVYIESLAGETETIIHGGHLTVKSAYKPTCQSHADVTGKLGVKYLPVTFHLVTYLSFNANATFLLLFNNHRVCVLYYWPHHVNE